MKKMMFIAAIALCAMSCGNKAANAEAEATNNDSVPAIVEEVATDSAAIVEVADSVVAEVVDSVVAE